MKKVYFVILITGLIISCSNRKNTDNKKVFNDFPNVYKPEINRIGSKNFFHLPMECEILDTNILILDQANDYYFYFINKKNREKINLFYGKKGKGPGEISFIPSFTHQSKKNDNYFWFFDFGKLRLCKIELDSIKNNPLYEPHNFFVLPPEISSAQELIYMNDTTIVASGIEHGRFCFWNPKNDKIKYLDYFPELVKKYPDNEKGIFFNSHISKKPDCSKFVAAMSYFKKIDIINSIGNIEFIIKGDNTPDPVFMDNNQITSDKTIIYYNDVFASNKYIYALYFGLKGGEINNPDYSDKLKCEIHIFDWKGNPITKLIINKPLVSLTVDEANNTIYGINPYDEEQPLLSFKFNLKKTLTAIAL